MPMPTMTSQNTTNDAELAEAAEEVAEVHAATLAGGADDHLEHASVEHQARTETIR